MSLKIIPFLKFALESAKKSVSKAHNSKEQAQNFSKILNELNLDFKGANLLEIGTGIGNYFAYSMAELGADITGIDIMETNITFKSLFNCLFDIKTQTAIPDRIKNFIRIFLCLPYKNQLSNLQNNKVSIKKTSINALPFQDNYFDGCYSFSVLEHIQDIEKGLNEIYRVLKPGGWGYHVWHPFTSLTGGHVKIDLNNPWGHLRGESELISRGLNRIRLKELLQIIEHKFKIIKIIPKQNDNWKTYLSDEIKKKFENYSADELLNEKIIIIFKKR